MVYMDDVVVRANSSGDTGRNAGNSAHNSGHSDKKKIFKRKIITIIIGALLALAVLAGGWFFYQSNVGQQIDNGKYQAVFFTNGQVYFGKLQKLNGDYFKLTDIFYLQAPAATPTDSKNPQLTTDQQAANVQLIKLGNEIHGPDDAMVVNKQQVLFFENLKKDGKVTDSITKYHNQKN